MLTKDFFEHPFIESIATTPKWSVSNADKVPIDMHVWRWRKNVVGANPRTPFAMCALDDVVASMPDVVRDRMRNAAYWLEADIDQFCVIDIESKCPPDVREMLLNLPWIYGEVSMSGQGYHLVMPLPENANRWPQMMERSAIKHKQGWYEILIAHWVTFTGDLVMPRDDTTDWERIWSKIAENVPKRALSHVDLSADMLVLGNDKVAREAVEWLVRDIGNEKAGTMKTLDDFHGDNSRYEFYIASRLLWRINRLLGVDGNPRSMTDEERAVTTYKALTFTTQDAPDVLAHRDKHDETRDGLPLLMYTARNLVRQDR